MSRPIDCTGLESRLAALLSDEVDSECRASELRVLRAHVEHCDDCAAVEDLLELLELPVDARELTDLPAAEYWESFNARVHSRVEQADSGATRRWRIGGIAAAVVLIAAPLVWLLLDASRSGTVSPGSEPDLIALFEEVGADQALGAVELVAGLAGPWDRAAAAGAEDVGQTQSAWTDLDDYESSWPFPDTNDLEPEVGRMLLEWLRQQEGAT